MVHVHSNETRPPVWVSPLRAKKSESGHCLYRSRGVMKGVLSVEVEIPSLRVLIESEIPEAEWIKERFEQ